MRQCWAGHMAGKLSQVRASSIPAWKTELQGLALPLLSSHMLA